ncbi:hypothetical protein BDW75DRAFT_233165 [Aspergillus navahoensis]
MSTALILLALTSFLFRRADNSHIPIINGKGRLEFSSKRIKDDFVVNGRRLLREGLERWGGKPFRVFTDFGPLVILAPEYAHELRIHENLNHVKAIAKIVNADYPGLEAFQEFAFGDNIVQDVIIYKLTHAVVRVTKPLSQEASIALDSTFADNREWHRVVPHQQLLNAVARVSSRLFLGDRLCRDPNWIRITTEYTRNVASAFNALNTWPPVLRRLVCRFLGPVRILRRQVHEARNVLEPVLGERRALKARGEAPEYTDAIEWFDEVAKGRKYNSVNAQLTLSFVAIHTTADLITQLMFDLGQNPEYIKPLRNEVIEVVRKQGWQKSSLYNLKLMDSVLKGCQRLRPVNDSSPLLMSNSDGKILQRNAIAAVASTRHWDAQYYPNPDTFDRYRFLRMRSEPGKENVAQFVATSPNHLGFGHGKHACPGRFFASNEAKIILCHIHLKYDWRLISGHEPKYTVHGWNLVADQRTQLEIRRREPEIDLDSL